MSAGTAEVEVKEPEVKEPKAKKEKKEKPAKEKKPEVTMPVHPVASKLGAKHGKKVEGKLASIGLWTIEGKPGLFAYKLGCRADHNVRGDEVVGRVANSHAVFTPDEKYTEVFREALGINA